MPEDKPQEKPQQNPKPEKPDRTITPPQFDVSKHSENSKPKTS